MSISSCGSSTTQAVNSPEALTQQVGIATLKKALKQDEQTASALLNGVATTSAKMAASPGDVGYHVDVKA